MNNINETETDDMMVLSKMIFLENHLNNKIFVECSEFKSRKELYFFCIELTMTGLRLLYGDETGKVDIEKLSEQNIGYVKEKLYNCAIDLNLEIKEHDINNYRYIYNEENIKKRRIDITQVLYDYPKEDNKFPLSDYKFIIQKLNNSYIITFNIIDFFF